MDGKLQDSGPFMFGGRYVMYRPSLRESELRLTGAVQRTAWRRRVAACIHDGHGQKDAARAQRHYEHSFTAATDTFGCDPANALGDTTTD